MSSKACWTFKEWEECGDETIDENENRFVEQIDEDFCRMLKSCQDECIDENENEAETSQWTYYVDINDFIDTHNVKKRNLKIGIWQIGKF